MHRGVALPRAACAACGKAKQTSVYADQVRCTQNTRMELGRGDAAVLARRAAAAACRDRERRIRPRDAPTHPHRSSAPCRWCSRTAGWPGTPPHCRSPPASPARPNGMPVVSSRQRSGSPNFSSAVGPSQHHQPLGLHRPGIDRHHAQPVRRRALAQRAGERHQRGIARRAGDVAGREALARGADDVDDHAGRRAFICRIDHPAERDVAEHLQIPRRAASARRRSTAGRPAEWHRRCSPGCRSRPPRPPPAAPPRRSTDRRRSCARSPAAARGSPPRPRPAPPARAPPAITSQPSSASTSAAGPADALRAAGDQRRLAVQLQVHRHAAFRKSLIDTPGTPRRRRGTAPGWRCRRRSPIPDATARRTRSRGAFSTRTASIVPSGARASTTQPGAGLSIAWPVQRVHQDRRRADDARQLRRTASPDASARTSRSSVPGPARWSARPATSCTCWCSVPPSATFSSWMPRQIASTGMPRAIASGISRSVVASRSRSCRCRASRCRRRRSGSGARCSGCRAAAGRRAGRARQRASPIGGIRIGSTPAPPSTAAA